MHKRWGNLISFIWLKSCEICLQYTKKTEKTDWQQEIRKLNKDGGIALFAVNFWYQSRKEVLRNFAQSLRGSAKQDEPGKQTPPNEQTTSNLIATRQRAWDCDVAYFLDSNLFTFSFIFSYATKVKFSLLWMYLKLMLRLFKFLLSNY